MRMKELSYNRHGLRLHAQGVSALVRGVNAAKIGPPDFLLLSKPPSR
jgi:hypothetical protein